MRTDELVRELRDARDAVPTADVAAGRQAVTHAVRRHQTRRVAAIALCAVVLLGAVAATMSRVGNHDAGYATSTEGLVKMVPGPLPDGLKLEILSTEPTGGEPFAAIRTDVFARPGAAPGGDSVAFVHASQAPRLGGSSPSAAPAPTTVSTDADGRRAATHRADSGDYVVASSTSLSGQELIAAAERVRFLPSGAVDPATAPAGYEPVVSGARSGWYLQAPSGYPANGYAQIYRAPRSVTASPGGATNPFGPADARSLAVFGVPATQTDLDAARWMLPGERDLQVRGHAATAGSSKLTATSATASAPGGTGEAGAGQQVVGSIQVLAWMETDTTLVNLTSADYSIEQLVQIAEGMRVDPSGFRDLQAVTTTTILGPGCVARSGGGVECQTTASGAPIDCAPAAPPATGVVDPRPGVGTCQGQAEASTTTER